MRCFPLRLRLPVHPTQPLFRIFTKSPTPVVYMLHAVLLPTALERFNSVQVDSALSGSRLTVSAGDGASSAGGGKAKGRASTVQRVVRMTSLSLWRSSPIDTSAHHPPSNRDLLYLSLDRYIQVRFAKLGDYKHGPRPPRIDLTHTPPPSPRSVSSPHCSPTPSTPSRQANGGSGIGPPCMHGDTNEAFDGALGVSELLIGHGRGDGAFGWEG